MELLDRFRKTRKAEVVIGAPTDGECIHISKVSDPTFAEEILGKGIAVIPHANKIVAPADGTVKLIFPTGHAFTMSTEDGVELMVHIGVDTVALEGKYFTKYVDKGVNVKKGDLIIEADIEGIKAEGYDTSVLVVVRNTADFEAVETVTEGHVSALQDVISIWK